MRKKIRVLIFLPILFACSFSFARKPSSSFDYKCNLTWKTMSEGPVQKSLTVAAAETVRMTDRIEANIKIVNSTKSKILVKEFYKNDPTSFLANEFSCDRFLNCEGSRKNVYQGKVTENTKFSIDPTGYYGIGRIGKRDIFSYVTTNKGFVYDYIVYRLNDGTANGLRVVCDEKK